MSALTRRDWFTVAAIACVALGLRLWGLEFGMPLLSNYYVRPDESLIVEPALRLGQDPRFFFYPALMAWITGLAAAAWRVTSSLVTSPPDLTTYFLIARVTSAVCGALVVWPVYDVALRWSNRAGAITAASLLALSPLAVRESHYGVTDTLLMLCNAMVLRCAVSLDGTSRRSMVLLGLWCGLAASAKYTAIFLAPGVVLAVVTAPGDSRLRNLGTVAFVAALVFVGLNPWLFANLGDAMSTARVLAAASYARPDPQATSWTAHLARLSLPLGDGPGMMAGPWLGMLGLAVLWRSSDSRRAAWLATGVVAGCGLPMLAADVLPFRYTLPLFPIVAVLAGVASATLLRSRRVMSAAILVGLVAMSAVRSARLDMRLARADTRTLAGRWIDAHVPAGCAIEVWASPETEPQLLESPASIRRRIDHVTRLYGSTSGEIVSRMYRVALRVPPDPTRAPGAVAREVYRATEAPPDASCVAVVMAGYPGAWPMPVSGLPRAARSRLVMRAAFSPIRPGVSSAPIEPLDGFFLPLAHLDRVDRPGPIIDVLVYEGPSLQ